MKCLKSLIFVLALLSLAGCNAFGPVQSTPPGGAPITPPAYILSSTPAPNLTSTPAPGLTSTPAPSLTPTLTQTPTPSISSTFSVAKLSTIERNVPYCTLGGSTQIMDIFYPSSNGPWPVVIYLHGGSWLEGDKKEGESWHFLTGAGFLLVSVNYRLADDSLRFPAMIEDVKCAVRHLRANAGLYNLDPQRIAIMGWSAGGHLAALAGTADESAGWEVGEYLDQSSRVQAVVSIAGLADLTRPVNALLTQSIYYAFGDPAGTLSPLLQTASPVTYITADDPPFFIVYGTLDEVVDTEQSKILNDKLSAAGVPVTYVVVTGAYHSLLGPEASLSRHEIKMLVYEFLLEALE